MKYLFDTADIAAIKKYSAYYSISGVTTNPSIIKKEGKADVFGHLKELREVIGDEKELHVQVLATDCLGILKDAETLINVFNQNICVKIPATEEGLRAIRILKEKMIPVSATSIYTKQQAYLAMEAGADYIIPYYNRMENCDIDPRDAIYNMANIIDRDNYNTKIIAASFKNMGQVNDAIASGAHAVTVDPVMLHEALEMPMIQKAVRDFTIDWESTYGEGVTLSNLPL